MKVEMSPKAIEDRLKLVGELTKTCTLLRLNKLKRASSKLEKSNIKNKNAFS